MLGKGSLTPPRVFSIILSIKIISILLVQTWYVPDEYWQSLEVAHKFAFGYGELTWEWTKGIRSYLYPGIFTILYKVLQLVRLDYAELVVFLPRILQATISAAADYSFYKWSGNRKWALYLILTSWFWLYTSSRTLVNTFETALVVAACSMFPFKDGKLSYYDEENNTWLWIACLCFYVRPTSGALWVPLIIYNLLTSNQERLKLITKGYLPACLITLGSLSAIDSYFHGSLIFTPWEFFKQNILKDIGSFYGTHPWYWYASTGLPAVLGVNLPIVLWAVYTALRHPREHKSQVLLLGASALHIAIHSLIPHKEFRFILPLLPIFLYISQDTLAKWSRKAAKWQIYAVAGLILVGNIAPSVYFGQVHQRATLQIMPLLRNSVKNTSSVLFLTPCHSTPLYSHLHANITMRYLSCEPPLESIGEVDESERFFLNPARWWRAEHAQRAAPTHVVLFDKLLPRVQAVMAEYRQTASLPHTQFPEGEVSENLLLFEKVTANKPRSESATNNPQ